MSELTWRKDPPNKPGWWLAFSGLGEILCYEVYCSRSGEGGVLLAGSEADCTQLDKLKHEFWSGPIEPPRREG